MIAKARGSSCLGEKSRPRRKKRPRAADLSRPNRDADLQRGREAPASGRPPPRGGQKAPVEKRASPPFRRRRSNRRAARLSGSSPQPARRSHGTDAAASRLASATRNLRHRHERAGLRRARPPRKFLDVQFPSGTLAAQDPAAPTRPRPRPKRAGCAEPRAPAGSAALARLPKSGLATRRSLVIAFQSTRCQPWSAAPGQYVATGDDVAVGPLPQSQASRSPRGPRRR